jgi:hypothetical protein
VRELTLRVRNLNDQMLRALGLVILFLASTSFGLQLATSARNKI